jgi:beta-glucosidase
VRFGLHEVDRATFARTPKPSAAVYAAIAHSHGGSL